MKNVSWILATISCISTLVFAGEKPSDPEADIASVANASQKDEKQHVSDFLRSPNTITGVNRSIAMNAINIVSGESKVAAPLARCCKRLALDTSVKKDDRNYSFRTLTSLAERDKGASVIAVDVAKEISRRDNDPLKQKADLFLSKQKR